MKFPVQVALYLNFEGIKKNICSFREIYIFFSRPFHSNRPHRCSFILQQVGQVSNFNEKDGSQKRKLKKNKSSIKLKNLFRRVSQMSQGATGTVDDEESKVKTPGRLFGRAVVELCGGVGQTDLPPPVCNMLSQLFQKGPGNCQQ